MHFKSLHFHFISFTAQSQLFINRSSGRISKASQQQLRRQRPNPSARHSGPNTVIVISSSSL